MNKIYLNEEFDKFWAKIENRDNFAFVRYGDGERSIMIGKSVKAQEGWISPNGDSLLGKNLLNTLNNTQDNFYYGISCPCCDNEAYYWYLSRINNKNLTFANLFANYNFKTFKEKFKKYSRDAIFIGNYRAKGKSIGQLNILKGYYVDDDCFKFYDNKYKEFINSIKHDFGQQNNLLYVISCGPLSEIIINDLYNNNPNNCYIDFGSSIDEYIYSKQTRPYMDNSSSYAEQRCWMYNPKDVNVDVSVILSAYKKPETLKLQLEAIRKQTLKPKEILLFQDGIKENYQIKFNEDLLSEFDNVEICTENSGVWKRFDFANRIAKSEYVCIFDDDTIPGPKWLENCMTEMLKQEGLYGTIGILLEKPETYPANIYKDYYRIGWEGNLDFTARVDFVGHSWFLKKEWLKYLFEDTEQYQKYKYVGEDMTLSYKLKQHGINTFVPPHPKENQEYWGSLSKYAVTLGNQDGAVSRNPKNITLMNEFVNLMIKNNFITIKAEDENYFNFLKKALQKTKKKKKKCIETVFSIRNEYKNGIKYKVITFLAVKIKFKTV